MSIQRHQTVERLGNQIAVHAAEYSGVVGFAATPFRSIPLGLR
jgi:hypothetical protein